MPGNFWYQVNKQKNSRSVTIVHRKEELMRDLRELALLIGIVLGIAVLTAVAQEKLRTFDEEDPRFSYKDQPVSIVKREFKGRVLAKGEKFAGDKDWLSNVSFEIKNTSNKPIVYLYVDLVIDGRGKIPSTNEVSIPIAFGNSWAPLGTNSSKEPTASIKPGEVTRLSVSAYINGVLKKMLAQYDIEDFERISVDIRHIHFNDGTGWSVGFETRQDPNDPIRWKVFNPNQRSPSRAAGK